MRARLSVAVLALLSCREKVVPLDATPDVASTPVSTPVPTTTARSFFDASEPIALLDDDRILRVRYEGGMARPCEKTKTLVAPPSGDDVVDLEKGTISIDIDSHCDGHFKRTGALPARGRSRLKELVAALAKPDGSPRAADGPRHVVTITRANGYVAVQGDEAHDGNAADIADYLRSVLEP